MDYMKIPQWAENKFPQICFMYVMLLRGGYLKFKGEPTFPQICLCTIGDENIA